MEDCTGPLRDTVFDLQLAVFQKRTSASDWFNIPNCRTG